VGSEFLLFFLSLLRQSNQQHLFVDEKQNDRSRFILFSCSVQIESTRMAQLQVTVIEAKNLKKKDKLSENDPFVEIYLDDKHAKQKTKTKQNSKNPKWNQTLFLYVQ